MQQMQQQQRGIRPPAFPFEMFFLRRIAPLLAERNRHAEVAIGNGGARQRPITQRPVNRDHAEFLMTAQAERDVFDPKIDVMQADLRHAFV